MNLIQPQAALFEPDSETICVTVHKTDHTTEQWASFTCMCVEMFSTCAKKIKSISPLDS